MYRLGPSLLRCSALKLSARPSLVHATASVLFANTRAPRQAPASMLLERMRARLWHNDWARASILHATRARSAFTRPRLTLRPLPHYSRSCPRPVVRSHTKRSRPGIFWPCDTQCARRDFATRPLVSFARARPATYQPACCSTR
ncbi:hypothetical protein EXIGLDRAFT_148642 [Exidia glandulosa HHB12029]|uniref:Uncharacterized protein n=1 Tax=Exidia glandulosa HHB12029 TaxID=1314781 RepID=A0A166A7U0_EXIGL|nr:hypothetical protein EXIGLDRAFT_148642 [Exidia glandulosa HHB12029]